MKQLHVHEVPRVYRDLARKAVEAGWKIHLTNGMHLKWCAPSGAFIFSALTPSDWRAPRNVRNRLQKAGLSV